MTGMIRSILRAARHGDTPEQAHAQGAILEVLTRYPDREWWMSRDLYRKAGVEPNDGMVGLARLEAAGVVRAEWRGIIRWYSLTRLDEAGERINQGRVMPP